MLGEASAVLVKDFIDLRKEIVHIKGKLFKKDLKTSSRIFFIVSYMAKNLPRKERTDQTRKLSIRRGSTLYHNKAKKIVCRALA